jgi:hypothetical protein
MALIGVFVGKLAREIACQAEDSAQQVQARLPQKSRRGGRKALDTLILRRLFSN